MRFHAVIKGGNIHLQETKNLLISIEQTIFLSYLSVMVSPMAEVMTFSWVLNHKTICCLPALQVCLSYIDKSTEHTGEEKYRK